jgi:hypothetical protein
VQQFGLGGQAVEVVPLGLERGDGALGLEPEADPVHIVALEGEHFVELLLALPVAELGAVQQHDAARHHAATALGARARAAQNRGTVHVALEQLPDVAHGEDVRVDHNGAALISHQLGRHEAQWREGLQIVIEPEAPGAVTQVVLPVAGAQEIVVLGVDEANLELVGILRVSGQGVARNQGAHHLLVVGVDEDAVLHGYVPLAGGHSGRLISEPARWPQSLFAACRPPRSCHTVPARICHDSDLNIRLRLVRIRRTALIVTVRRSSPGMAFVHSSLSLQGCRLHSAHAGRLAPPAMRSRQAPGQTTSGFC